MSCRYLLTLFMAAALSANGQTGGRYSDLGVEKSVRIMECSFYGELVAYGKWFLAPIVAGISADFDTVQDPDDATEYLAGKGIAFSVREADDAKGYGKSDKKRKKKRKKSLGDRLEDFFDDVLDL